MVSSTVLYLFLGQILIALFLFYLLPISSAEPPQKITKKSKPIITLSHGQVRGTLEKSQNGRLFSQFVGIPYAQPPIGKLRFARPQAWTESWNETILDANQRAPVRCVQYDDVTGDVKGTEDCLKLNIYVPLDCCVAKAENDTFCPLMTFIHPGDFQTSDAGPQTFGPQLFMNHRVVLLSFNYRLGPLGFLSTDDDEGPGNLGLRDQSLALQWAKKEARNFCADPDKITIFGSGAGGESVLIQMLSPFNHQKNGEKLFHRVISQSGSPIMDPKYQRRNRRGDAKKLAQNVGCGKAKDWFQCLRYKVDSATLLRSSLSTQTLWVPKVDQEVSDPLLPQLPYQMLQEQKLQVEAVMLGHNSEEGTLLVAPFLQNPSRFVNFTASMPPILFKQSEKKSVHHKLLKLLKKAYIPGGGRVNFNNVKHAIKMVSDYAYTGHVGLTADELMRKNSPIYFYHYGYSATHSFCDKEVYYGWKFSLKLQLQQLGFGYNMRNGYGICRGDELFAMFVLGNQPPPMNSGPFNDFDRVNSAKLMKIWTDFASSATPNDGNCTENCLNWTPLTPSNRMIANMKTSGYIMNTDEMYWQRIKVFKNVHNILNMHGNEDLQLQKIQALLQSNNWWDDNVESSSKDDL